MADKATGRYADPARIHKVSHRGRHFTVAGPLNDERPPQGYPLLVQAGSSEDGKDFAARHAEAIFTAHQTYERASEFYADIKKLREAPRPAQYPDGPGLAGGGSAVVSTMGTAVKAGPLRRLYRTALASRPIWSGEAVVGTNMSSSQPTEANASA